MIGEGFSPTKFNATPDELEAGLCDVFDKAVGASRRLVIEWFERHPADNAGLILQATIFAKGSPRTETVFHDDQLANQVFYPAVEAAVTYEPETGQLDVMSKGGAPARDRIADLFALHVFQCDEKPAKAQPRNYHLGRLKSRFEFVTDTEDMIENVWVDSMTFLTDSSGFPRITIDISGKFPGSIWARCKEMFGEFNPFAQPGWRLKRASFRVRFHKFPEGGRQQTLRFSITYPNGCNLKEQTERERLIGEKYLSRWGLVQDS